VADWGISGRPHHSAAQIGVWDQDRTKVGSVSGSSKRRKEDGEETNAPAYEERYARTRSTEMAD